MLSLKEYTILESHDYDYIFEGEDSIVITCCRAVQIDKTLCEARALEVGSNGGEDGEDAHDAIIRRCEEPSERESEWG